MNESVIAANKEAKALSERHEKMLAKIAKDEGIPTSGLTILGGKPYVNVTGLDVKLRAKCKEEKLVHIGTEYIEIHSASKENMHASGWGIVKLFDRVSFEKALAVVSKNGAPSAEVIGMLRDLNLHIFKMRGFASPETLQMRSMQALDNVEHMAERRATNRAKREATGTGLTSLEEIMIEEDIESDDSKLDQGESAKLAGYRDILVKEFGRLGVTADMLLKRFEINSIDDFSLEMMTIAKKLFTEISFDAAKLAHYFPGAEKSATEREHASAKSAVDAMMGGEKKDQKKKSEKKPAAKEEPPAQKKPNDQEPTPHQTENYLKCDAMIKKAQSVEKLSELSEKIADLYASKALHPSQASYLSKFIDRRKAAVK